MFNRLTQFFSAALVGMTVLSFFTPPATAAVEPLRLTEADRADVARIEANLNGISTMQARFVQITSAGDYAEGRIFISRPGKLRLEYDPPTPILIIANGTWLTYFDSKLKQVSHVLLSSTPAALLVTEDLSLLSGGLTITGLERGAGTLRLTVVKTEEPAEGSITLVFSDRPLALKKWVVIDAQGLATTVSLLNPRTGLPLSPKLFHFKDPRNDPDDR